MAGRALVFSNSRVIRVIRQSFIPYAGDQWYLHRQKDALGEFFWKVAQQGHNRHLPEDNTRQGIYAATPDGELLGSVNTLSPQKMLILLESARQAWERSTDAGGRAGRPPTARASRFGRVTPRIPIRARNATAKRPAPSSERRAPSTAPSGALDPRFTRRPPEGGMILNVFTRIPREPGGEWTPNRATGRDHVWLTRAEWRSLLPAEWREGARYPLPPPVARRLVRFHLVDNVRGEPPFWEPDEVREADLSLRVTDAPAGRLELKGTARMQASAGGSGSERGCDVRLQGVLVYDRSADRFTAVDLLAWGEAWGEGRYTGGAPPGRFPLVIAFSLAGDRPPDRVPPQAARGWEGYFGTGE